MKPGFAYRNDWQRLARLAEHEAAHVFRILLLAVSLALFGDRFEQDWLVVLSKCAVSAMVLLQFGLSITGTVLVLRARRHLAGRWRRVRTPGVARLRKTIRKATQAVLFTWPLAIAGLFLPPVMGVPAKVPGTEVLFGLLLAAYAMQWWFALVLGEMATTLVQSRCLPRRLVMFA